MLRRLLPVMAALVLLALPAFAGSALAAPSAKEVPVQVIDNAFEPKTITIDAGDTIVWTNTGQRQHTVTASDGAWDSGLFGNGQTFSRAFDTPGTINYYCIPHGSPDGQGMAGTIVVQAASMQQPAAPAQPAQTAQPSGPAPSVQVSNQPVANNSVTVARTVAAQDGWMVIHTNTPQNAPGPVLGHSPVKAGENTNVRVTLSQAPNDGDMLWAMLHVDAGQVGTYEFPGADAPVNVGGQIVMTQFTVQGGAMAAPAQAPSALPNTGSGDQSNLWMFLGGTALAMLLGGALALRRGAAARRS